MSKKMESANISALASLAEHAFEAVILGDVGSRTAESTIVYANQAFCDLTGYSREQLIGRSIERLRGVFADRSRTQQLAAKLLAGDSVEGSNPIHHRDGSTFPVHWRIWPVRDENEKVVAYAATFRHLSGLAAEESSRRLQNVLLGTNAGTWEWRVGSKELVVNDRWLSLLGFSREEMPRVELGDWRRRLHPDDLDATEKRIADHIAGVTFDYEAEFRMRHRDGHWVWILARGKVTRFDDRGRPLAFSGTHLDITALKQAEEEWHAEAAKFRALFEGLNDAAFIHPFEPLGMEPFLEVNEVACRRYGYTREQLLRLSPSDLVDPESHRNLGSPRNLQTLYRDGALLYETRHRTRDGHTFPVEVSTRVFNFKGIRALMSLARDISVRKRNQARLLQSSALFDHSHNGILVTDSEARIISINPAFERITGYRADEVIGRNPRVLQSDRNDPSVYRGMWRELRRSGVWRGEIWNRRKDGTTFLEWQTITAIRDDGGDVSGYISTFSDITSARQSQRELLYIVNHNALTGLPNRRQLEQDLGRMLATGERLAVYDIDIDGLKNVNQIFGHASGDAVIAESARRLRRIVPEGGKLAHVTGDEFIIVTGLSRYPDTEAFARRILETLDDTLDVEGARIATTGTVGIAISPEEGSDGATLLRHAHQALAMSKRLARNSHTVYSPEAPEQHRRGILLESRLKQALARDELVVCYQPQLNMDSGEIIGHEALLRWRPPGEPEISPAEFIPIAEQSGQIVQIGAWVLRRACLDVMAHQGERALPSRVAVNLSGRQLIERDVVEMVSRILAETGMPPRCLELEITETFLIDNPERIGTTLSRLRELGVSISIDDFGTGQSSLSRLKNLPVDKLKIDRAFVRGITEDSNDAAIARMIIALARNLGLQVLAEGVETPAQSAFLLREGCVAGQGFLFSKAREAGEILGLSRLEWQRGE